jgi:uncharacterized protein (DUF2252 family)
MAETTGKPATGSGRARSTGGRAASGATTRSTASKTAASKTAAGKTAASKTPASRGTGARSSSTRSRGSTAGSSKTPASKPSAPRAASPARSSTARPAATRASGTRSTRAGATSGTRASRSRTAAANGPAAARLLPGVPEGARKSIMQPRNPATGLEDPRPRLTAAERRVRGKAARAEVPRESHAEWQPSADRPDPVALLDGQAASRLPDLVPVRYGRMMETPFTYFRGAALPMASDLARTPATGILVQACGDAHLSNFGLFGSPERKLVFDVNDFDETLPGPWEWDVKRLAASMEVAARDNGFADKDRRKILLATGARYRATMRQLAGLGNLDVWYTQIDIEELRARFDSQLLARQRKALDKGLAKARTRDSMQALSKLCRMENGQPRITPDPPVVVPIRDLVGGEEFNGRDVQSELVSLLGKYRRTLEPDRRVLLEQYEFTDMARKVVGVGSVGTRCWIVLMLGRDENDPLFLQVKEAQESVLAPYAGASKYVNQGQRVVVGQRLMQAASDIFLGWQRVTGLDRQQRDFYFRQLRDWKFSVDIGTMIPRGLRLYGELCGATLARAHARSGDEIAIATYLGNSAAFENAIAEFAVKYADQNERDYEAFTAAIESGRLSAERGV